MWKERCIHWILFNTWGVMAQLLFDFAKETTPARWLKQIKGPKIEFCYCYVWLLLALTIGCNLAIVSGCSLPPPESPTQAPSFPSPAQMELSLNDVPSTGTYILLSCLLRKEITPLISDLAFKAHLSSITTFYNNLFQWLWLLLTFFSCLFNLDHSFCLSLWLTLTLCLSLWITLDHFGSLSGSL